MDNELATISPLCFAIETSNRKLSAPKHLQELDDALCLVTARKIKRLIINMPPRHGKSELTSKYFPAWYLGKKPDQRIILTSYEANFAAQWGRKTKELIAEYGGLFNIELNPLSNASNRFDLLGREGGLQTAGAGGPITGKGADILIIDDPIKNDEEANSKHQRNKIWDWFQATAFTRLEPNAAIILIMTRWHEDDLAGRILEQEGHKWTVLDFKAIAEDEDVLGRLPGEALWSDRFPMDSLNEIKESIGTYWFSALYQQEPKPSDGGIFKRKDIRFYDLENDAYTLFGDDGENKIVAQAGHIRFMTVDLATKAKETADYTVLCMWDITADKDLILVDAIRVRIDGAGHLELVTQFYNQWHPQEIDIESTQYQITLVQQALKAGLPAREMRPEKDKVTRALTVATMFEAHKVYIRRNAAYTNDFIEELVAFPHGSHDDVVDNFSMAGIRIVDISQLVDPFGGMGTKGTTQRKNSIRDEILNR